MVSEWKEYRLKELTGWSSGGTPSKQNEEYWGGEIPWISASSMNGNRYFDSKLKVTEKGLINGTRLAPKDTILLLVRGSILHQKIQVGITLRDVAFNQDVKGLSVNEELIEPWYLLFWFMANKHKLLGMVENTGIGAGKLDTRLLQNLIVQVPPATERIRILKFAKALDEKIELNRRMNETLEQMAQALFKSWFVDFDPVIDKALAAGNPIPEPLQVRAEKRKALGEKRKPLPEEIRGLFPDRFVFSEEMGWIPEGWEVKAVDQLLIANPRISLKKGTVATYADMKSLPTSGFGINGVIQKEYSGGAKFQQNDVLLARITPCLENGKTGIVDFLDKDKVGFGSTEFIVLRGKEEIKMPFVACLARELSFRSHCIKSMVGSSGRQRVQPAALSSFFLAIPGREEIINRFHKVVEPIFNRLSFSNSESGTLSNLRDTLLPKLISGEIRVGEAEKLIPKNS